jgi:hypothetical protein
LAVRVETLAQALTEGERQRLVRRAQILAWSSLAWMTAEGVIAVVAGIMAGSIALIGFGIDSGIEGVASVIIIWRFWGARAMSEHAERRAQKLVAVQFFILAPLCRDRSRPHLGQYEPSGGQLPGHRPHRA